MKKIVFTILLLMLSFASARAADKLPEIMNGQTEVTVNGTETYFGGFIGNESVLNFMPQTGQTRGKSMAPSLSFDGTDDYVDIGDGYRGFSTGLTLSVWACPTSAQSYARFFDIGKGQADENIVFARVSTTNNLYVSVYRGNTNPGNLSVTASGAIETQDPCVWQHLAVTITNIVGTTGTATIYKNGVSLVSGPINAPVVTAADRDSSFIGKSNWSNSYYRGKMDEARIYSRGLSSAEILNLYHNDSALNNTGLVGYWDFNEGTGLIANDTSTDPVKNDGALVNGTAWDLSDGPSSTAIAPADDLFGFDQENLLSCLDGIVIGKTTARCFIKNSPNAKIGIMTSRTYFNNLPVLETAALVYPSKTVAGDVYGTLNDFAFWGRNLHQASGATVGTNPDATWQVKNYAMNSSAQASLDTSGTEYVKYVDRIDQLKGEAGTTAAGDFSSSGTFNLQSGSNIRTGSNLPDTYPEGKVWKYTGGNLAIPANYTLTYSGKGTIIVDGTLTIGSGASIVPLDKSASSTDRIGFIVLGNLTTNGDVTTSGNNDLKASIFSTRDMIVNGNNNTFTGSFVAQRFSGMAGSNIRFYYDYGLDSAWPPGFRYLNMPHAGETSQ